MPDALALPGVGDVHQTVTRLDYGGVRILTGSTLQRQHRCPVISVRGERHVQRGPTLRRVIVDQQKATVAQCDGVDARVRVGDIDEAHRSPSRAIVGRIDCEKFALLSTPYRSKMTATQVKSARLDCSDVSAIVDGAGNMPCPAQILRTFKMHAPPLIFCTGRA